MRLVLRIFVPALVLFAAPLCAKGSLYTDEFKNIVGTLELEDDGEKREQKVELVTGTFGIITGMVGDAKAELYKDAFGNITGTIGKKKVDLYEDAFGNLTGTIGDQEFDCYRDAFGNTECK